MTPVDTTLRQPTKPGRRRRTNALTAWWRDALGLVAPAGAGLGSAVPALGLRTLARMFWPYARPFRAAIGVSLVLVAAAPVVETARIWLFKLVVDDVLVPAAFGPFVWLAIGYVGLTLAAGAVQFLDEVVSTWAGERFLLAVRTDVFAHLHRVPLVGLERRPLGDLISRLTGDVAAIEGFVLSGLTDALSYALQLCVFTGVLVYLDWRLALVALVVAPLFGFLARWFSSRIREASREKRRRTGALTAVAEESLANAMLVRAYRAEQRELDRFRTEGLACLAAQLRATRLRAVFSPAVDLVETVGALVVIGFGVWELSRGRLSLGGLLVFLAYVTQLYGPIRGLSRLATSAHAAAAGAERIAELLRERPEVEERPGALALGRARGVVEIDRVSYTYPGADRPALADLTLRIAPGEMVALVGPSGAGKSTLVRLLLRLCDPDSGAVRLDGHDLRDLQLGAARDNVAVVLQETLIVDGSIRDNVTFGVPDATDADVERAARLAGAHEFVAALPDGYATRVGQRGRSLSGGQRQRLSIARAFLAGAPVLVLDEPTAALDAHASAHVLEPLRRLRERCTTLVVTHDLAAVCDATEIVVLDGGRTVERGRHQELVAAAGPYAAMWQVQAGARGAHAS